MSSIVSLNLQIIINLTIHGKYNCVLQQLHVIVQFQTLMVWCKLTVTTFLIHSLIICEVKKFVSPLFSTEILRKSSKRIGHIAFVGWVIYIKPWYPHISVKYGRAPQWSRWKWLRFYNKNNNPFLNSCECNVISVYMCIYISWLYLMITQSIYSLSGLPVSLM